jgi:ABC-type transporter Mla subunit MlaD
LTRLPHCLSCLLAGLPNSSTGSLFDPTDSLSTRLAQPLAEAAEPLADAAECLPCGSAELSDRTTRAERLSCRVAQSTERLARRTSRLHGLLCRLADIAEGLADGASGAERILAELADAPKRVVNGVHEALEDFRVAVEGGQRPVEDVVQVLQPHLQLGLDLHALDVDLDLTQVDVHACDHLQQVREFRPQRQMCLQLLDVDVDLVDLHFADVNVDIRIATRRSPL